MKHQTESATRTTSTGSQAASMVRAGDEKREGLQPKSAGFAGESRLPAAAKHQEMLVEHAAQDVWASQGLWVRSDEELVTRLKKAKASLRVYRALVARTAEVFGDELKAARWLSTPNVDFDGMPPMQAAQNVDFSKDKIEDLFEPVFVRIEEGIYW